MKKKAWKIAIIAAVAFLVVAGIVCMALFIPVKGKPNEYFWSYADEYKSSDVSTLNKTEGKDFKILQVADLQLWTRGDDNKKAFELVDQLVADTTPDLIVLTGDNVSGIMSGPLMDDVIKKFEGYKIPWAPIFGNHDSEIKYTVNYLGDKLTGLEYCKFSKGPGNLYGSGNYVLNIKEGDKYLQSLVMFDNGRYIKYTDEKGKKYKKEVYMSYEQIAWYRWNILGLEKELGYKVPSMSFAHFAVPEFNTAIKEIGRASENDYYIVPSELGFGSCKYLPGVSPVNSGYFDAALELGSTHSMFFGHDHENDASINYKGIRLTYGLKTGPSPRPWNDAKRYGGTLITIGEGNKVNIEHVVKQEIAK